MVVSNRNLLFQGSIFRGYVSFREGIYVMDYHFLTPHRFGGSQTPTVDRWEMESPRLIRTITAPPAATIQRREHA